MPKVSVIIPVYNVEKYLRRCLDSVLAQTFTDWECILVDDGSPDRSGEICDEYAKKDSRISVIHKENGGVSRARNIGIKESRGEWITFIDSDDWVEKDYLTDLIGEDTLYADTLYSGGIRQITPTGRLHDMFRYTPTTVVLSDNINVKIYSVLENGCPVAKLFNRAVLLNNSIEFNTKFSLNEDHLFVITYLCYVKKVALRSEVNYNYWFDNTVPSLTKSRHSIDEYLSAAVALNKQINILCNINHATISDMVQPKAMQIFGAQQIARAAMVAFTQKAPDSACSKIVEVAKSLTISVGDLSGFEKKIFILIVNGKYTLARIATIRQYAYLTIRQTLVRFLKKYHIIRR